MDLSKLNISTKAVVEVAKTIARAIYFGVLGFIVLLLTIIATSGEISSYQIVLPVVDWPVNLGAAVVAGAAGLAKLIDRYVRTSENNDSNGIAPGILQK